MEKCDFCDEQVFERKGGTTTYVGGLGDDFFNLMQQMSKRKFVCPSCGSVFCLECGNDKGKALGTGSTHCPKCGFRVL